MDERSDRDIEVIEREPEERADELPAPMRVRDSDMEPHAGLRYIARLFKGLAVLLILLLFAEFVIGLTQEGASALPTLMVEATRLVVFACFLWAGGDIALMVIEANHDLRATRLLVGRMNMRIQELVELEQRRP